MSKFERDTLEKWKSWLPIIHQDLVDVVTAKYIFWSVNDLLKKNKEVQVASYYYQYMGNTYAIYAVMGIRRQLKNNKDSISMLRLLEEIRQFPQILSRSLYIEMYKDSALEDLADKHFEELFESTGNHISTEMVTKDIENLKAIAKTCEEFADKKVAHLDKNRPKAPLKFKELDDAIDMLDRLYCKYHLIFTAGYTDSVLPTFQYDWQAIFDKPWRK